MSARSASHGSLRRSSSLTTLSRPSIGVGQRGAQRVSGAAFDSKVKNSGGNSMILFHKRVASPLEENEPICLSIRVYV